MLTLKRILYLITSSDFGGAETLFYQHITHLDRSRFEPFLISLKKKGAMALKLEKLGFSVETVDLNLKKDIFLPWRVLTKLKRLTQLIRAFQPDILHASLFQADVFGALCGARAKVPVRLASVHMVLRCKFFELVLERLVAPWVTRYLAVSHEIRSFYVKRLGLPSKKIQVLYNAVNDEEVRQRAREPVEIKGSDPFFVMVGRIDPQKDLDTLFDAVTLLKKKELSFKIHLIGDGPDRERLTRRRQEEHLDTHIDFLGFQKNPMPFIAKSRGLVLSSHEEGLPMVVLEAMALGKAIVSTSVGALPEVVMDGESGLLVPRGNALKLAEALEVFIQDEKKAKQCGEKGNALVQSKFSLNVIQKELENLYLTF